MIFLLKQWFSIPVCASYSLQERIQHFLENHLSRYIIFHHWDYAHFVWLILNYKTAFFDTRLTALGCWGRSCGCYLVKWFYNDKLHNWDIIILIISKWNIGNSIIMHCIQVQQPCSAKNLEKHPYFIHRIGLLLLISIFFQGFLVHWKCVAGKPTFRPRIFPPKGNWNCRLHRDRKPKKRICLHPLRDVPGISRGPPKNFTRSLWKMNFNCPFIDDIYEFVD